MYLHLKPGNENSVSKENKINIRLSYKANNETPPIYVRIVLNTKIPVKEHSYLIILQQRKLVQ